MFQAEEPFKAVSPSATNRIHAQTALNGTLSSEPYLCTCKSQPHVV